MDIKTEHTIRSEIHKWRGVVEQDKLDQGRMNSPLCQLFDPTGDNKCKGCPVKERTGKPGCIGTLMDDWTAETDQQYGLGGRRVIGAKSYRAARAVLTFMQSLLPKEKR